MNEYTAKSEAHSASYPMHAGGSLPSVNAARASGVQVQDGNRTVPPLPHALGSRCLIKHSDNFTLTCHLSYSIQCLTAAAGNKPLNKQI
jgi:hypothetical protein